jgi:nitrous oxide reductase accessory protein NosL
MKKRLAVLLGFFLVLSVASLNAAPVDPVDAKERCAVCGMFVAKYQPWIAQLHAAGETPAMFDGVKDMMAYYFKPGNYGGAGDMASAEVWVKDYYTQEWIDGRAAYYVVGSDVMGPMGDELIPFDAKDAAENFKKDHKGKQVMLFDEISMDMIMEMKKKHMMKMKGKKMQ